MQSSRMMFAVCFLMLVVNMMSVQPASLEDTPGRTRKRSYSLDWRGNTFIVQEANKMFKPARNTISRPYYIPIAGPFRHPIYYPPQPYYRNPGAPLDNPMKPPFQGLPYLPPSPTKKPGVDNRFSGDDYEDEGMPVWGDGNMGSMQLSGGQETQQSIVPTRPPINAAPIPPPLVHTVQENQSSTQNSGTAQRPESSPQSSTQAKEATTASPSSGPSNCVWAIISCCPVSNSVVFPDNCFEQRGCPGPFWGNNPCNSENAKSAIAAAAQYFSGNRFSDDVRKFS